MKTINVGTGSIVLTDAGLHLCALPQGIGEYIEVTKEYMEAVAAQCVALTMGNRIPDHSYSFAIIDYREKYGVFTLVTPTIEVDINPDPTELNTAILCLCGSVERECDWVTEHKHTGFDYWHPVSRVHNGNLIQTGRNIDTTRTAWDVNEDGVYDIIDALSGRQAGYVDRYGVTQELEQEYGTQIADLRDIELFSYEWANALASVNGIHTTEMLCRSGVERRPTDITVSNGSNEYGESVKIHTDPRGHGWYEVTFEECTQIVEAMRFAEEHRITLCDALHVLYVLAGGAHKDIVRLPDGGHIPPEILVHEYGVSWETIAKIPLGKPRDGETFACPLCGARSFFAGICDECRRHDPSDFCDGCDGCDDNDTPCKGFTNATKAFEAHERKIREADDARTKRKEFEHGAILRMIKSGTLERKCRYMRGGD